jgi:hypothetical protein
MKFQLSQSGEVRLSSSGDASASSTSWLCRDDFDRERMLDMEGRVRPARQRTFGIIALALLSTGPWLGWWPLLFLVPSVVCFAIADTLMPRAERPEHVMFAAWLASELTIAGAVSLNGGPRGPALSWLAIPVITLSSRFSMRGWSPASWSACCSCWRSPSASTPLP